MLTWRAALSPGSFATLPFVPLAWGLAVWLAGKLSPVSWWTFWLALGIVLLVAAGVLLLYWSLATLTMRYAFDRNALIVSWGGIRQSIPMNRITAVRPWAESEQVRERGLHGPGLHRGRGVSPDLGPVEFYATAGRQFQVLVCTPEGAFVLSPRDGAKFIQEVELRRGLGITRQVAQERSSWWLLGWSFWRDRPLWIIGGLAIVFNLALFALLCYWYPILRTSRPLLPLHYSLDFEEGRVRIVPDFIGPVGDLFKLPAFGLLLLGGDLALGALLHRRHRLLALLLAGVALLVQLMFGLGAVYILYH